MRLLQISGNQVWPNLLPLLALKPSTCVFLTSRDPAGNYRKSAEAIIASCADFSVHASLEIISTDSNNPTVAECRRLLEGLQIDCVNLTGGTKPMSIAAYDFARERGIPAFYLDTRRQKQPIEIVLGQAAEVSLLDAWKLSETTAGITVPFALKAHGFPVPDSFKEPSKNWLGFSIKAAEVRMNEATDKEIAKAISVLRMKFKPGNKFLKAGKLRKQLAEPIHAVPGSAWESYLLAAEKHLLCRREADGFLFLKEDPARMVTKELEKTSEKTFNLIEGLWFELALLNMLKEKKVFSDICWSVEADRSLEATASSRGETDLVAFDPQELVLHFISCKTTGPHGAALDHIQGLRGRASKEGGKFSKACLWIFRAKDENHRRDLQNHCDEQGVILRVFTDLTP